MNLRSVFTVEQQRILQRYYENGMTNQSKNCFQLILQCAQETKLDFSVVRVSTEAFQICMLNLHTFISLCKICVEDWSLLLHTCLKSDFSTLVWLVHFYPVSLFIVCFHWNVFTWLLFLAGAWIAQGVTDVCLVWVFCLFVFCWWCFVLGFFICLFFIKLPIRNLVQCIVPKKGHVFRKLFLS